MRRPKNPAEVQYVQQIEAGVQAILYQFERLHTEWNQHFPDWYYINLEMTEARQKLNRLLTDLGEMHNSEYEGHREIGKNPLPF